MALAPDLTALPERVRNAVREGRPVPSPCLSICRIDERTGWCEGCWRSLEEIALWGSASDAERLRVWGDIVRRQTATP